MASGIPTRANTKPRTTPARTSLIPKAPIAIPKRTPLAANEIDIGSPTTVVATPKSVARSGGKSSDTVVSASSANLFYSDTSDAESGVPPRQRVMSLANSPSVRGEGSVALHRRGQSVAGEGSVASSPRVIQRSVSGASARIQATPTKPRPKTMHVEPSTPKSTAMRTPQQRTPAQPVQRTPQQQTPTRSNLKNSTTAPWTPVAAADLLPGVPWSDLGELDSPRRHGHVPGRTHPVAPTVQGSVVDSVWARTVDDSEGLDLITIDEADADDDFIQALEHINAVHLDKVTHYKRLLERAQSANAAQLHALQAELRIVRGEYQAATETPRPQLTLDTHFRNSAPTEDSTYQDVDLAMALRGDGRGNFNETEVKKAVRSLRQPDRMRLLTIILDSLLPGDISQQIHLLHKYAKSTFDVLATLPVPLALHVLSFLGPRELLAGPRLVSKAHHALSKHPALWRLNCLRLTSRDPIPPRAPKNEEDWEPLYKSLHFREENWRRGAVQGVRFLSGHTGFVTSMMLRGKRLISGSYDETIRIWDVDTGVERKCLQVKKPVSCLDFLTEEEVFVVGFHDVGRVHVFSSVTYTPLQQMQGHLYGIRAVALSTKYCVSAGADKALVVWDWRAGTKVVRFGQQTNLNVGVQIFNADKLASVTIDGMVRVFSIGRREMVNQFRLSEMCAEMGLGRAASGVGVGANNMLQWFAAKGSRMTCATKNVILHLEWDDEDVQAPEPASRKQPSSAVNSPITAVSSPLSLSTRDTPPPSAAGGSRARFPRSTSISASTPLRQSTGGVHLGMPSPVTPNHPSLLRASTGGPMAPRTPGTPGTPGTSAFPGTPEGRENLNSKANVRPPRIVAVVESPEVAVGSVDPGKRRVVTATRFSSRAGADRRILISTHREKLERPRPLAENSEDEEDGTDLEDGTASSVSSVPSGYSVDRDTSIMKVGGAWAALAEEVPHGTFIPGLKGVLPASFKGLATPEKNPMSMQLSHEEVVVGCGDGTIYVMSFVGHDYVLPRVNGSDAVSYSAHDGGSDTE